MTKNKEFEEWEKSNDFLKVAALKNVCSDRLIQTVFEAGQQHPSFEIIKSAFAKLTPEQRIEIMDDYCRYCGNKAPCSCMNDE